MKKKNNTIGIIKSFLETNKDYQTVCKKLTDLNWKLIEEKDYSNNQGIASFFYLDDTIDIVFNWKYTTPSKKTLKADIITSVILNNKKL